MAKTKTEATPAETVATAATVAGGIFQLRRNANGHLRGETFTGQGKAASGLTDDDFIELDPATMASKV
jgi:hypothetical protein